VRAEFCGDAMFGWISKAKRGAAPRLLGAALAIGAIAASPASAQVRTVDPDAAIDGDLAPSPGRPVDTPPQSSPTIASQPVDSWSAPTTTDNAVEPQATPGLGIDPATGQRSATWQKDDLIGAAEGVFGKGAKGIADVIEGILKKQGEPNAYIVGREGGGAFVVGVRYGSGTLYHKVEGQKPVYWRGPSIGFDAGANAGSTFVLVYNLYDSAELFHNYPAGEGAAYFIGGFNVSYLRRKDVVLVPVRLGAGLRLGINAGYMRFSDQHRWVPF
jgi:hypothetical protein